MLPSGEMATSIAYPEVLWPRNPFYDDVSAVQCVAWKTKMSPAYLAILSELAIAGVDNDLVVRRLEGNILAARMRRSSHH